MLQQRKLPNPMTSISLIAFQISSKFRGGVGIAGTPRFVVDYLTFESIIRINVGDKPIKRAELRLGIVPRSSHMHKLNADRVRVHAVIRSPVADSGKTLPRLFRPSTTWRTSSACPVANSDHTNSQTGRRPAKSTEFRSKANHSRYIVSSRRYSTSNASSTARMWGSGVLAPAVTPTVSQPTNHAESSSSADSM